MPTMTPTDAQFGIADEPIYGVRAAPTRFFPLAPGTKLKYNRARIESEAVVAGLDIIGSDQWAPGAVSVEADFGFELYRDHIGLLLKHMFGAVSTTGTVHTFTPGPVDDLSFCAHLDLAQVNAPALVPVELLGCKVPEWEIAAKFGEKATLGLTVAAQDAHFGTRTITDGVIATNTSLVSSSALFSDFDKGKLVVATGITPGTTIASVTNTTTVVLSAPTIATATGVSVVIGAPVATPSYGSLAATPFMFHDASVTVGGGSIEVKDLTIKGSNALATNRGHLGSPLMAEPLRQGRREFTVDLGREFRDLNMLVLLKAGIEAAVVSRFAAGSTSLVITMNCRWDEVSPTSEPTALADEPVKLKVTRPSGTNASAITAVLTSASATV